MRVRNDNGDRRVEEEASLRHCDIRRKLIRGIIMMFYERENTVTCLDEL